MPMLRASRTLSFFGVPWTAVGTMPDRGARLSSTYRGARRNAARDAKWPSRRRKRKEPKFE